MTWPDERLLDLIGIDLPIVQAPMAGSQGAPLAIAVSGAGGLGSLPCALLRPEQIGEQLRTVRRATDRPVNLNFFCHTPAQFDGRAESAWRAALAPFYEELDVIPPAATGGPARTPFDSAMCEVVEELRPRVVSFHFGLPPGDLLERVRDTGATVMSSATTVAEARWLEDHGCGVVIAQGAEAGGHRAMFLTADVGTQPGTLALVPQVVDAVSVPVVAAGGIADGRGIAAAFALGASGVQIGTAYLFCPEAAPAPAHLAALRRGGETAITNVFTGRPARSIVNRLVREIGPISPHAPAFPLAAAAVAPLSVSAEFIPLWSGQGARLAREMPAADLTRALAEDAQALMSP